MQKLARALGMLSKVRHYDAKTELKNIYHAIFESHLRYWCQIWYQLNIQFIKVKIAKLQKKALRIILFADFLDPSSPLFKEWKILKSNSIVEMQNCLPMHSSLKGKLPKSLENLFQKSSDVYVKIHTFQQLWVFIHTVDSLYLEHSLSRTSLYLEL